MVTIATPNRTCSILLVGDGDPRRDWRLPETLELAGYAVHAAESGEIALDDYNTHSPDLVLIEKRLPGIDAIETCRRLLDRYRGRCAPILLVKDGDGFFDENGLFPEGIVDYVSETSSNEDILVHIHAHVASWRYARWQRSLAEERAEALRAQGKFLRMCAHDLRTPLSSICGLAEFLVESGLGSLNERQAELAEAIRDAGQDALKLVNQLFDYSLADAGRLRIERSGVSLREMARRAVFMAQVVAAKKCIRLVLQPTSETEPELMIDVTRIREVMDNLLSNAVKYSPPGSTIGVAIETLPAASDSDRAMRFSVRDQGPGVPAEERDLLFQEFGKLSARPTGGEKSTGLGLAICRKIIDLHGGSIGAVNHPEGGCVFSFILPISPCT